MATAGLCSPAAFSPPARLLTWPRFPNPKFCHRQIGLKKSDLITVIRSAIADPKSGGGKRLFATSAEVGRHHIADGVIGRSNSYDGDDQAVSHLPRVATEHGKLDLPSVLSASLHAGSAGTSRLAAGKLRNEGEFRLVACYCCSHRPPTPKQGHKHGHGAEAVGEPVFKSI